MQKRRHPGSNYFNFLLYDLRCQGFTLIMPFKNFPATGNRVPGIAGVILLNHCCGRGVQFPAPHSATSAFLPVVLNAHMSHFSSHIAVATEQFAVNDNPTADTRTQGNGYHMLLARSGAKQIFAKCHRIGIIIYKHGELKSLLQIFPDWNIPPGFKIGRTPL